MLALAPLDLSRNGEVKAGKLENECGGGEIISLLETRELNQQLRFLRFTSRIKD